MNRPTFRPKARVKTMVRSIEREVPSVAAAGRPTLSQTTRTVLSSVAAVAAVASSPTYTAQSLTSPYFSARSKRYFASPTSSGMRNGAMVHIDDRFGPDGKVRVAKKRRVPHSKAEKSCGIPEPDELSRTESFEPLWAGSLSHLSEERAAETEERIEVHTLVLGTHPSITSLGKGQYFGHNQNAFWWIAGDCLGFRRDSGISESTNKPFKLTSDLRYGLDRVIPYEDQVRVFASKGFALWDLVQSCERKGSLDQDIKNELANPIREFCDSHPSVRRIVIANGTTGCAMFSRHFRDWWLSGELKPAKNEQSTKAFKRFAKRTGDFKKGKIEVVCALAVSPAAAIFKYADKRDFWETYCYHPGLNDYEELMDINGAN